MNQKHSWFPFDDDPGTYYWMGYYLKKTLEPRQ